MNMGASQKLRTANIPNPLFIYCIKNPPFRIAAEVNVTLPNFNAGPLWVPTQNKPTNQQTQTFTKGVFVVFVPSSLEVPKHPISYFWRCLD